MSKELFRLSVPCTSLLKDPSFDMLTGRKCRISYEYESEKEGFLVAEQILFDGIESYKCTYYIACDIEMIEAYGRILEVGTSPWLGHIIHNLSQANWNSEGLKHLRIFFDDGPCYEFICRSFEVISLERPVTD